MNTICPKCKCINPPRKLIGGNFASEYCHNVVGKKKLFGLFETNVYCGQILYCGILEEDYSEKEIEISVFDDSALLR